MTGKGEREPGEEPVHFDQRQSAIRCRIALIPAVSPDDIAKVYHSYGIDRHHSYDRFRVCPHYRISDLQQNVAAIREALDWHPALHDGRCEPIPMMPGHYPQSDDEQDYLHPGSPWVIDVEQWEAEDAPHIIYPESKSSKGQFITTSFGVGRRVASELLGLPRELPDIGVIGFTPYMKRTRKKSPDYRALWTADCYRLGRAVGFFGGITACERCLTDSSIDPYLTPGLLEKLLIRQAGDGWDVYRVGMVFFGHPQVVRPDDLVAVVPMMVYSHSEEILSRRKRKYRGIYPRERESAILNRLLEGQSSVPVVEFIP